MIKIKKGRIDLEYIIIAIILLALLIVLMIASGILREKSGDLISKVLDFILGK